MNQTMALTALLVSTFLVCVLILIRIYSKKLGHTPREIRHFDLKLALISALAGLFLVFFGGLYLKSLWFFLIGVSFMMNLAYIIFKKQTQNEILANYDRDPEHCGRCDYNLTGNLSGICPECGWSIPQVPVQYERPDWSCWWKQWSIDYLISWRKKLAIITSWMVAFTALGIVLLLYTQNYIMPILSFFMSLIFSINFIRIVTYARRQRQNL